jgi:hypothetical protein
MRALEGEDDVVLLEPRLVRGRSRNHFLDHGAALFRQLEAGDVVRAHVFEHHSEPGAAAGETDDLHMAGLFLAVVPPHPAVPQRQHRGRGRPPRDSHTRPALHPPSS